MDDPVELICEGGTFDGQKATVIYGYAFYTFAVPEDLPVIQGIEPSIEDRHYEVYNRIGDRLVFKGRV